MIEDKLTQEQRLRLEAVAQANALISVRAFQMTTDVDEVSALLTAAEQIFEFLQTGGRTADLSDAARYIRRYGLTAAQWCEVMAPAGPESFSDFDWSGLADPEGVVPTSTYRMDYPEFCRRSAGCTWKRAT